MYTQNHKENGALFSRLALKIIVAICTSVLVIQLVFIGYIESSIYESELESIADQQITFTEASSMYIAELAYENNEDSLYLILSSIVANPLIVGATIKYTDGRDQLNIGSASTNLEYSFEIKDLDENDDLVTIALLTTYATTEFIDETRSARIYSLIGLALIVLLVIIGVSVIAVQAFIGIPLKRITQAISSHSRTPIIQWKSADEIGAVVKRLNYLHAELNNRVTGLENELSENERREADRIRSLSNATLEGILIFQNDEIVDLNEPMAALFGRTREETLSLSVSELFDVEINTFLQQSIEVGSRPHMSTSLVDLQNNSVPVELYINLLDSTSTESRVAVVRDISERMDAEKAMWRLAHYDSLTGLPNRRYFAENLDSAIRSAQSTNSSLSVAYLDLDNFKFINDSRGHAVGDELLCAVAKSMQNALGCTEYCARLGGDEFAIPFAEDQLTLSIEETVANVFTAIQDGELCSPWQSVFGLSIGVATLKGEDISRSDLLTQADLALYKAKENGKSRICFYSDHIDAKLKRERLIIERLIPALERNQLKLHYQPQIKTDGSSITGFEALLRWQDPLLGTVSPEEIIEIAEREGLVSQLGRWVIDTACHEASHWPQHIRLAVNLSPLQLADESLPSFVESTLAKTGVKASRFEIEITETALVSDAGKAKELIDALKAMGILIALDDFGTGYSSLSMLQSFPIDRIKIDRSFVRNLTENNDNASIVASIIDLGARLGLDVIAEGVETEDDLNTLKEFNCVECQGYLVSKPLESSDIRAIIDRYEASEASEVVVPILKWKKAV